MDLADLTMNYPKVRGQVESFMDECGTHDTKKYQLKWLMPRWFPFTIRVKLRYLPSKKGGRFEQELPLSIRP